MQESKVIKFIYTFFVGILIALFVGVGVNTFYPGPKAPDYNNQYEINDKRSIDTQNDYTTSYEKYSENARQHSMAVSIIVLCASVILLIGGVVYEKKLQFISNSIILGGLFTLIYSIGRGFASENNAYSFIAVTAGLALVIYLGYHKFVKVDKKKK